MNKEIIMQQVIEQTADEIMQLIKSGLTGELLRSAIKGALRGIAVISAQK